MLLTLVGLGKMSVCADIAYDVAVAATAKDNERIDALDALIVLADPRLLAISASLPRDSALWSNRLTRLALTRLFPRHLSVEQLCRTLSRVTEKRRTVGEISWYLPRRIEQMTMSLDTFDDLRVGLTALVAEGVVWDEKRWPHLASRRSFLLPALASTCLRQLRAGVTTPQLMTSIALALRLPEREHNNLDPIKQLRVALRDLPAGTRRLVFEADDSLLQAQRPQADAFRRFARLAYHGAVIELVSADAVWILEMLGETGRSEAERAMLLEAALSLRDEAVEWSAHLTVLKGLVSDLPKFVERLDELSEPRPLSAEAERSQREDAERQRREERIEARDHASWVKFWGEIVESPDTVFADERAGGTAWSLWRAMRQSGDESRSSGWNRRFIERHFSKDVADRLRLAVMSFWRNDRPTLRSERPKVDRDSFLIRWQLGLAGLAAEAEDPRWAEKLTANEVELALKYVPIELNGFPGWLQGFVDVHPNSVDAVLGKELTTELNEPATDHSAMLQSIQHSAPSVGRLFVPRLRDWLDTGKWRLGRRERKSARASRLRRVVQILMQFGDENTVAHVHALAKAELADEARGAVNSVWLPVLMRVSPAYGVEALERSLEGKSPKGSATKWFSALFGDPRGEGDTYLSASGFTPDLLLRLARLAYQHIRPADDIKREGSYSPVERDHSQRGRTNIINALLSTTGPEGWAVKLRLAEDPLFADFKDRALAMALERSAEEADAAVFVEAQIVALDRYNDLPPLTRDEMFSVMNDRLDDIEDALLHDDSPRAAWALIEDEKIMRRQIARELRSSARNAYNVDQEAVTADEKETDIRLRSTGSQHEAVIELKIGEKDRSAADLKATIRDQLVVKYMAAENSRAGCLLITVNSPRTWKHPDTGAPLDLTALIAMLNEEARHIERDMGSSLRLIVRGLNLQPRLSPEPRQYDRKRIRQIAAN